jgi:MFS-type transporter involved in bile tolerance (Atg22 family)
VAIIADRTGSIRSGFIFLLVALILPQPFLASVDMEKGSHDAECYAVSARQGVVDEAP